MISFAHFQSPSSSITGGKERLFAVRLAPEDSWLYYLDSDNGLGFDFFNVVARYLAQNDKVQCILFSQILEGVEYDF